MYQGPHFRAKTHLYLLCNDSDKYFGELSDRMHTIYRGNLDLNLTSSCKNVCYPVEDDQFTVSLNGRKEAGKKLSIIL